VCSQGLDGRAEPAGRRIAIGVEDGDEWRTCLAGTLVLQVEGRPCVGKDDPERREERLEVGGNVVPEPLPLRQQELDGLIEVLGSQRSEAVPKSSSDPGVPPA
jgi:hypothetical protein